MDVIKKNLTKLIRFWPSIFGIALFVYTLVCVDKFWRTNDDTGMGMIACGFGVGSTPSPYIVYSNFLWGWLVGRFCGLLHASAYGFVTYAVTLVSLAAISWGMYRRRVPQLIAVATLIIAYVPLLVLMQFTFVAGYMAAAGLLLIYTQTDDDHLFMRITPWILLFVAALIRFDEFLVVCATSSPFFLTSERGWRHRFLIFPRHTLPAGLLCISIIAAYVFEAHVHAQSPEWQSFEQIDPLRADFTDFNLAEAVDARPDLLHRAGLTHNDVALIADWFYLDPAVFDVGKLQSLSQGIPFAERMRLNLASYDDFLRPFRNYQFALLLGILLVSLPFLHPRWPAVCAATVILLLMLATFMAGRPGITRIFVPMMLLIDGFALSSLRLQRGRWFGFFSLVALGCGIAVFANQLGFSRDLEARAAAVQQDFRVLPRDVLYVIWGGYFPYRQYYQPFIDDGSVTALHVYGLDSWETAPFALDTLHRYTGGLDFVPALLHGQTFRIFAPPEQLDLLQKYFSEHYRASLRRMRVFSLDSYDCYQISVTVPG
jgi:hypothetical protein